MVVEAAKQIAEATGASYSIVLSLKNDFKNSKGITTTRKKSQEKRNLSGPRSMISLQGLPPGGRYICCTKKMIFQL